MKFIKLSFLTIVAIISNSVAWGQEAPEQTMDITASSCLDVLWKNAELRNSDKEFDEKHDQDIYGNAFSCSVGLTPSEINRSLQRFKEAVAMQNRNAILKMTNFPVIVFMGNKATPGDRLNSAITREIETPEQFKEQFNEIFLPQIKRLIKCTSIDELRASPMSGIGVADSLIWLQPDTENRRLYFDRINILFADKSEVLKELCAN